jgi:hypothetical protein
MVRCWESSSLASCRVGAVLDQLYLLPTVIGTGGPWLWFFVPQPLQATSGIVPQNLQWPLLSTTSPFHYSVFIRPLDVALSDSLTASLNNERGQVPVLNYLSIMPWRRLGEWRYSSFILDLCSRWRRVVSFTLRPLYSQGYSPWYPLNRKLGEPQSRSGHCVVQKNVWPLPGIEPRPPSP